MPQPLPHNTYDPATEAPLEDAYSQCLMMEAAAGADVKALVLARCLGYLIRELPCDGSENVANKVVACNADFEKMMTLSKLYMDHLIRLFRQNKGNTPAPSEHPSRPPFEAYSAFFSERVEPAPKDHKTAKKSALKRDNFRCVVTGWVDLKSYKAMDAAALQRYSLNQNPPLRTGTNFCHIFPPSTNWFFDPTDPLDKKKKYAGNVWAIINNFRSMDSLAELDGAKIHSLENGFTMDVGLHGHFDDLLLWFEHIINNTYRICAADPEIASLAHLPANPTITFTSTDPTLPLPNPEYLKLHAAVCRVAHMSGAAGYLDLEDRDVDRLGVLSRDGSSADLLSSRLQYLMLKA